MSYDDPMPNDTQNAPPSEQQVRAVNENPPCADQASPATRDPAGQPHHSTQGTLYADMPIVEPLTGDPLDVQRRRNKRAQARDVQIAPIANPERRGACRLNLRHFLETYLAPVYPIPWSSDHLTWIARLQDCIINGNRYVIAAPRGSGKSTIVVGACIWALLFGHRRFLAIFCANHANTINRLESIRTIIETNQLLYEDFPGPPSCVRALQGAWNRCNAQTVNGTRSYIRWGGTNMLVFPTIPGDPSAGACIGTYSMKKAIRGIQHQTPDGQTIRPDLVLLDDPIENEEAQSPVQVDKREQKILKDVLNLAGPNVAIAAIMLVTVITDDDLASRFLDRQRYPSWRGQKFKLMYAMPTNMELWDTYDDLLEQSQNEHGDNRLANAFYAEHQAAMDADTKPAWPERFIESAGEISAVQHAMNLYFDLGEAVFNAEYQNEPSEAEDASPLILTSHTVETSDTGLPRGVVPDNALALAAGWDIGKYGIHWTVGAFAPGRIVSIIDYGVQEIDAPTGKIDDRDKARLQALEAAMLAGLRRLHEKFQAEPYATEAGEPRPILLTLIDSRWQEHIIKQFCGESGPAYLPILGHGSSRNEPNYYVPQKTELSRDGNLYCKREVDGTLRYHSHSDAYKQIVHTGFLLDPIEPGSIAMFSAEHRKTHHSFARHLTAEMQIEKPPGSGVYVWEKARGRADNHWLDATCYAMAAGSILEHRIPAIGIGVGAAPETAPRGFKKRRRRVVNIEL